MTPLLKMHMVTGSQAACMAPFIWADMGKRERRAILWDVVPNLRQYALQKALGMALVAGIAWAGPRLAAIAWIVPVTPGSRCGLIHCCFMPGCQRYRHELALRFLDAVSKLRGKTLECLIALIPIVYRHARQLARDVGFASMGSLPGVCVLAGKKPVRGVLMKYELGGQA